MRGGAQAHLLEASDGNFYVVKFTNNPQHRRVLVNEWVAAGLFDYAQLAAPPAAAVELDAAFLAENPEVCLHLGERREPVPPGWHFGSRFPGDPARIAVYDFLPDLLLPSLANLADFVGAFVLDRWCSNSDARQCVFYRAHVHPPSGAPSRRSFVASFIDNGYWFDGPHWAFRDSPRTGLYFRPSVYQSVSGWLSFEPWLDRVRNCPTSVFDRILRSAPPAWIAGDEAEFERLLESLHRRRARVADLIEAARGAPGLNLFPNWR